MLGPHLVQDVARASLQQHPARLAAGCQHRLLFRAARPDGHHSEHAQVSISGCRDGKERREGSRAAGNAEIGDRTAGAQVSSVLGAQIAIGCSGHNGSGAAQHKLQTHLKS